MPTVKSQLARALELPKPEVLTIRFIDRPSIKVGKRDTGLVTWTIWKI